MHYPPQFVPVRVRRSQQPPPSRCQLNLGFGRAPAGYIERHHWEILVRKPSAQTEQILRTVAGGSTCANIKDFAAGVVHSMRQRSRTALKSMVEVRSHLVLTHSLVPFSPMLHQPLTGMPMPPVGISNQSRPILTYRNNRLKRIDISSLSAFSDFPKSFAS